MLEKIATGLAQLLADKFNLSQKDEAFLAYGLQIVISFFLEAVTILLASWYLKILGPVLASAACFLILRYFAGGVHLPTFFLCLLVSLTIFLAIGLVVVSFYPTDIFLFAWLIITGVLGWNIITRYAPADTNLIPIADQEKRKLLNERSRQVLIIWLSISLAFLPLKANQLVFAASLGIIFEILALHPVVYHLNERFFPGQT